MSNKTERKTAPTHFVTFIRSSLFLYVMDSNPYLSIGFTLYYSFIHQHEAKVGEPNKGKKIVILKISLYLNTYIRHFTLHDIGGFIYCSFNKDPYAPSSIDDKI
ncbi:hypothetical protein C5695_02705 [Bacillus pumilus]|uniref:Uncharacterized protein n=1 Tax=Bacillus pumilus TaxID=1408 RepID=A0AAD0HK82_BACPU|nr:hypothetical protein C5695_02705 [Bacillus pumilus]